MKFPDGGKADYRTPTIKAQEYGFLHSHPDSIINRKSDSPDADKSLADSILAFYRRLIAMRKRYLVITEGELLFLEKGTDLVMAYKRALGEQEILVFCNLGSERQRIRREGKWKEHEALLENYAFQASLNLNSCGMGALSPIGNTLPAGDMDCSVSDEREGMEEFYTMKPYGIIVLGRNATG